MAFRFYSRTFLLSIISSIHHTPAVDSATWRVLRDCGIARTFTRRGCRAGSSYQRPIRTVMSHGRYRRDFADNIYHLQAEYDFNFSSSLIIHKPKTKEITTVKEVWICGLN